MSQPHPPPQETPTMRPAEPGPTGKFTPKQRLGGGAMGEVW
jgi:hypothetical protein